MLNVFKIVGNIDLEGAEETSKQIDKIDKKGSGLASKLGSAFKGVAKAGAVIGGAAAGAGVAMFGMANSAAGVTDRIDKMSQKLGLSREAFQNWDYIMGQNGISIDSMGSGMKTLVNQFDDLSKGGKVATDAFSALGLSYDDLAGLSQEEIFEKTVVALQGMEDETKRSAIANDLLGRSGQELAPLLNAGADSVEALKQQAKDLGIVLSDDAVDSGVLFTDTMDNLKRSFGTVFTQIGVTVMPIMQKFAEWIIANMPVIQGIFQTVFDVIGGVVSTAVNWIKEIISWMQQWFSDSEGTLSSIWEAWLTYMGYLQQYVSFVFNTIKDVIQTVLGLIVPFIQEKLGVIKQFWDENGAQIMEAVKNAFEFIKKIIETIMPIVTKVIEFAWGIISKLISNALNIIMGFIKIFSGIFTGDWSKIWEGVKQIVGSIFDTVTGIFKNIFSAIGNIMGSIWETIKNAFTKTVDWLKGLRKTFLDAGKGLIQQLIQGIKNMASKVIDTVKDIAQKIRNFLPFSPAKDGPMREGDEITKRKAFESVQFMKSMPKINFFDGVVTL